MARKTINKDLYKNTFNKYKNLMFFDGHQVDYFYFKSLETYYDEDEDYNALAKEIVSQAKDALAAPPLFQQIDDKEMPALQQLSDALDFLKLAVQYERSNELAYFKQKLALIKQNFSAKELKYITEVTKLEQLFDNNNQQFDYDYFILLINLLENGIRETKTIAEYEKNRIEEIAMQMGKLQRSRRNQLDGLWKSRNNGQIDINDKNYQDYIIRANERFNRNVEISYAKHGNLSSPLDSTRRKRVWGAKKYLGTIPETVDVKIAHWITDHINQIFNSTKYYAEFEALAKQYLNTGKANTSTIREMLVKAIVDDGVRHTVEILQDSYKKLPPDEFIQTLQESLESIREYSIKGYYSNFGQFGKTLKFFSGETLKSGLEVANGLYDAYSELVKELNKNKKNRKLSKEESLLMQAMKDTGHLQIYNRLISLISRLEAKKHEYEKIQRQIQEGRRQALEPIERVLNLGAADDGSGDDVKVKVKITADNIEFIDEKVENGSLNSAINRTSLIHKLGNKHSKATTIEGLIVGLKSKTSKSLRDDLSFIIASSAIKANKNLAQNQIRDAFEKALTGLKLSVGGPTVSEIAPGIIDVLQKNILTIHFPGKINRRNDLILITLQYGDITIKSSLQDIMDINAEKMVDEIDPQLKKIQDQFIIDFEDEFYKKMKSLKNTSPDFNSLKKNEEIWFDYVKKQNEYMTKIDSLETESSKLWAEYEEMARKEGISEEKLNANREQILSSLTKSFFISDTMKTYNQYQNNIGFGGPSLGANVAQQLNNIAHLFSKAGIILDESDLKWLQSAVINCSPVSIFGESNKNIIENYLGSMAALAIFDEGGAEAQIIADLKNKVTERVQSSPNILHLYKVNSIFVPGSVVLERTIEQLSKCLQAGSLAITTMNRGAGVSIINTMNEGLVPNRKTTKKRYGSFDKDPWGTVASATDSHVKIKILFLAGLLDIVKSMDKMMGDVELPQ